MGDWLEAKRDIIEAFDGKLIYEVEEPITFHLSHDARVEKCTDFIEKVNNMYCNSNLAWFLTNNGVNAFFDNRVRSDYLLPDGTKIVEGMKLLKTFKYFEEDEETVKRLQTQASMIIQEDKIEGTLCFSVHPLDYLSLSETTYNWRSCHALDGEYRSGNLSYMLDRSTIVCYLKGRKVDEILPRFPDSVPWNSKKWRMLIFLSERWTAMFAGRQYPFTSDNGLEIITPYLRKALKQDATAWSSWHNDVVQRYKYKDHPEDGEGDLYHWPKTVVLGEKFYDMRDLVTDGENSKQFNDLLRSNCYTPFYSWNKRISFLSMSDEYPSGHGEHFTIGRESPCVCCENNPIQLSDAMLCGSCYLEYGDDSSDEVCICDCCGDRVWAEDVAEGPGGTCICQRCADEECTHCASCGEYIFIEDGFWNRKVEGFYCRNCWNDYLEEV
jgi:hypothetical protein